MNHFTGLSPVFFYAFRKKHIVLTMGVIVLIMVNRAKIKIAYFIFLILKLLGFYLSR